MHRSKKLLLVHPMLYTHRQQWNFADSQFGQQGKMPQIIDLVPAVYFPTVAIQTMETSKDVVQIPSYFREDAQGGNGVLGGYENFQTWKQLTDPFQLLPSVNSAVVDVENVDSGKGWRRV